MNYKGLREQREMSNYYQARVRALRRARRLEGSFPTLRQCRIRDLAHAQRARNRDAAIRAARRESYNHLFAAAITYREQVLSTGGCLEPSVLKYK